MLQLHYIYIQAVFVLVYSLVILLLLAEFKSVALLTTVASMLVINSFYLYISRISPWSTLITTIDFFSV